MKKEYKFIAVGILALLAGAFFLMKDSYLFPWEKDWRGYSYGSEGYLLRENPAVSILDFGYRFLSIQEGPYGKSLVWSWKITYRNRSEKHLLIDISFTLKDSGGSTLASYSPGYGKNRFHLYPGLTETISDIVESPIYAKQASGARWDYILH